MINLPEANNFNFTFVTLELKEVASIALMDSYKDGPCVGVGGKPEDLDTKEKHLHATRVIFTKYGLSPPAIPQERGIRWIRQHKENVKIVARSSARTLILGDSIISGLTRYKNVWEKYLAPQGALNLGVPGDKTQNVLWRMQQIELPEKLRVLVILVGTNNVAADTPRTITDGITSIAKVALEKRVYLKVIVCGLLPRGSKFSAEREACCRVNEALRKFCDSGIFRGISYLPPEDDWVLPNGHLDMSLYFQDSLHLIEAGNVKLCQAFVNAIEEATDGKKKNKRYYHIQ